MLAWNRPLFPQSQCHSRCGLKDQQLQHHLGTWQFIGSNQTHWIRNPILGAFCVILSVPKFENHSSVWRVPFTSFYLLSSFSCCVRCSQNPRKWPLIYTGTRHLSLPRGQSPRSFSVTRHDPPENNLSLNILFFPVGWLKKTQGFLVFLSRSRYHLEIHFIII